jgi:flagellar hook-basal body complex protein FliE
MTQPIPPIDAVGDLLPTDAVAAPSAAQPAQQFGQWFTQELSNINSQMVGAEHSVQQLAAGGNVSLHETMLQLEQARLQFQLAIQVRSRVLEAYQDVMRMQV